VATTKGRARKEAHPDNLLLPEKPVYSALSNSGHSGLDQGIMPDQLLKELGTKPDKLLSTNDKHLKLGNLLGKSSGRVPLILTALIESDLKAGITQVSGQNDASGSSVVHGSKEPMSWMVRLLNEGKPFDHSEGSALKGC
jgi:hypothetical protein